MVRIGEEEAHAGLLLDSLVIVELGAVVGGDGLEAAGMLTDQPHGALGQLILGSIGQLADQGVAGLALDQSHDAVLAAGADHGVDLPVSGFATIIDARRPLADVPLARQASAAVVATIPFAPLFAGAAQELVQHSATAFVPPDVLVDRLVADREHPMALEVTGNLFGTPQVRKQPFDQAKIVRAKAPVAARTGAPAAGASIGLAGPVGSVVAAVAPELARDAAGVPPKLACYPRGATPLRSQGREHIPLSRGDLAIRHGDGSLLAGKGSSSVSQIASLRFQAGRCALTS